MKKIGYIKGNELGEKLLKIIYFANLQKADIFIDYRVKTKDQKLYVKKGKKIILEAKFGY